MSTQSLLQSLKENVLSQARVKATTADLFRRTRCKNNVSDGTGAETGGVPDSSIRGKGRWRSPGRVRERDTDQ
jgi:hypothetical protein